MSIVDRIFAWDQRRAQRASVRGVRHKPNLNELGAVAQDLLIDYDVAVADGAPREVLARILTGLAGCHLAMSSYIEAMGWDPRPIPGKPSHAEGTRLEGLLLLELTYAASEGGDYQGVRCFEFWPISDALSGMALAYAGWAPNPAGNLGSPGAAVGVGQRLDELIVAAVPVIGQAETLMGLARAHREAADPS